jgi:hypothetical protein
MTDYIEQARKSGELLGIVGRAAFIALMLCCGVIACAFTGAVFAS